MHRNLTPRRPAAALLITMAASVAITGCGGSHPSGTPAASVKSDGLKYAACVRAHGVPDFPDPGSAKFGGTVSLKGGKATVDGHPLSESAAVVQSATGRCAKDVASSYGPRYSAAQLARIRTGALAMSKCMRAHGLSSYPDLSVSPGPGGHGFVVGIPGLSHAQVTSPAFKRANITCSRLLNHDVSGKG